MNLELEGKTALITAASGGIGSGIAGALADAGVRVAISARTGAALEQVAEGLASHGRMRLTNWERAPPRADAGHRDQPR